MFGSCGFAGWFCSLEHDAPYLYIMHFSIIELQLAMNGPSLEVRP